MVYVCVTGASRGIGLATAEALVARDCHVAMLARSGEALAAHAERLGPKAMPITCDIKDDDAVNAALGAIESAWGHLDVLVNNAATLFRKPFAEAENSEWRALFDVNVIGQVAVTRALLPLLRKRRGRIVNVASISGKVGTPQLSAYCASKHAVIGLTRALAAEMAGEVLCNAVCPGSVDTEMLKRGLPGAQADMAPGDVANFIVFLALDAPRQINGAALDIFG